MIYKKCNGCQELKITDDFHKKNNGFSSLCKICNNIKQKKIRLEKDINEIEEMKKYLKDWRKNNKEKIKIFEQSIERKEYVKNYRNNNKEKISKQIRKYFLENKEYLREVGRLNRISNYKRRLVEDPTFAIKESIRSSIRRIFNNKGIKKNITTETILGCSYEDLKLYLESKFEDWMTWENRGLYNGELNYGWDIDHIIPISSGKTEDDIKRLNHFSNLQPLCSKINRDIKRDNINYEKKTQY